MPHCSLASQPQGQTDLSLFDGLRENIQDSFSGTNILLHAGGAASTSLLIRWGTDAQVYDSFRKTPNDLAWPGAIAGSGVAALAAGLALYSNSTSANDLESRGAAFVIAQASLITVSYVILLKSITGRAHPTNTSPLTPQEQSEEFEFFNRLRTGYGWPSGHMSHTVAVTSALAAYYPEKTWLKWLSLGLSSYMLYTVSAFRSAQMHWFSDGVAGAMMGYAIGTTVGENMRRRVSGSENLSSSEPTVRWLPLSSPGTIGFLLTKTF